MAITGSQKAYRYALSNVARSGASRSGYVAGGVFVSIGGVAHVSDVLYQSLTITDSLDEVPNTCTFRTLDAVPTTGQEIIITLGSQNNAERLFAGHVLTVSRVPGPRPLAHVYADVACVDYTWELGFLKVTKRYEAQTTAAIVQDLVATYAAANGFTATAIQLYLPLLDEITFTNEDLPEALTRLARRIGAYWYVDYRKDVHLFFDEVGTGAPMDLTPTHPTLAIEGFSYQADHTQALTRVYVEGRGSRVMGAVTIGDTLVPLEAVDMFSPVQNDVFLKASFQGSEGGAQHLTYSGVVAGGAGAIVGPGIGPSSPPTATVQSGAGVTAGSHTYAVTFVTASGESLASPTTAVTTVANFPNPTVAPTGWTSPPNYFGNLHKLGWYRVKYAYATDGAVPPANVTLASPASEPIQANTNTGGTSEQGSIETSIPCSSDPAVNSVWSYRTTNGGTTFYRGSRAVNVPGTFVNLGSTPSDATIVTQGTEPGTTTTPPYAQVALSAIPIGGAAVTQRKIYRSAAGTTTPLKLLTTIANNTATTYLDTLADGSLGANAPATDTSGLTQPAGSVVPGATSMVVAGTSAFQAAGGWAIIGNGEQVIRYTAVTASALTGIPTAGIGSITAAVNYNSTVTAAPMLTGIPATGTRSITRALTAGDELYLVVQVDDAARQAQLASTVGGTGIREEWVQDRRLSIAEARARGQATLSIRPLDQGTLQYRCRDLRTASGKTVTANLPAPLGVSGSFKIQSVTIDNFRPYPTQYPTFHVQASSTRFSFEDWLRNIRTEH